MKKKNYSLNKKTWLFLLFSVCVILVGLLMAETLVVKVQSTAIRKSPKFYAAALKTLKAGDRVEKIGAQNDWLQVKTGDGVTGWLHSSAVQSGKVNLTASGQSLKTEATTGEVALAAKGFNKQVEDAYRAQRQDLDYTWVERMLKLKVSEAELEQFLRQGRLAEFGGGQ
ncbi:MAG: SH3 domain-containing protein [Candidatus Saccharicenans sp.]